MKEYDNKRLLISRLKYAFREGHDIGYLLSLKNDRNDKFCLPSPPQPAIMEILGSWIFFLLLLGLVFFLLWLWTILDIIQSRFYDSDKLVWLVVVIFLPVLGTLLYLIIGRGKRIK